MTSYSSDTKSSAQLEREVAAQRDRVENTIGQIQDRLSPGQLLDEALSYTKHGGSHFAANLGQTVANNPLPATLLGVSLAWLMSGVNPMAAVSGAVGNHATPRQSQHRDAPYARATGSLRRTSYAADDRGHYYSEFADDAGNTWRARSNDVGHRAGHFIDETGKAFGGFVDSAGARVADIRDEAGNLLDEATGWASHTWHDVQDSIGQAAQSVMDGATQFGNEAGARANQMGEDIKVQADRVGHVMQDLFERQPLIAGALAFAAGAAMGAVLPSTREEDKLLGKTADKVKSEAVHLTEGLYEEGKERASELYSEATDAVGKVVDDAKSTLAERADQLNATQRH